MRREIAIVGPGATGSVKAKVRIGADECLIDVPAESLPRHLRLPNSKFVAFMTAREFVRVEVDGAAWLEVQDKIRDVLNHEWDPIGVSSVVSDEYDVYIDDLYRLLSSGDSDEAIASWLRAIESREMGLPGSSADELLRIAAELRSLQLPEVGLSDSSEA